MLQRYVMPCTRERKATRAGWEKASSPFQALALFEPQFLHPQSPVQLQPPTQVHLVLRPGVGASQYRRETLEQRRTETESVTYEQVHSCFLSDDDLPHDEHEQVPPHLQSSFEAHEHEVMLSWRNDGFRGQSP